jgi:hypothetical protein
MTDPDTGSRVIVRDDMVMRIDYPTGDSLLLVSTLSSAVHAQSSAHLVN